MFVVDIAKDAMIEAGVKPLIMPMRGNRRARLSFMGCLQIFSRAGITFTANMNM